MRPAWDELRMNPNRPISWNDRFGTDSMIGTSQSNADRPMELDLRSRRRSVSGLDRPKAITDREPITFAPGEWATNFHVLFCIIDLYSASIAHSHLLRSFLFKTYL